MTIVYGIKNCDTVKKACKWLEKNNIEFTFHDLRKDGLSQAKLKAWTKQVDWQTLLNRRGTTWRQLPESDKQSLNKSNVINLMLAQPTLIKRPVIEHKQTILVGFTEDIYQDTF